MNVLIGCECSGVVRDAFRDRGHNAWSCDLKPCEKGSEFHIQKDVVWAVTHMPWDFIGIHPDCTAMALSGNRWYGKGMPMNNLRIESLKWTLALWDLVKELSEFAYMENPTSVLFSGMPNVQYIQPWQFGHGETKRTGFARHNLPKLTPTDTVEGRENRVWKMPPGPNRKADRSRTFTGIADAMANQWG
jgi:hypothetical protein